jgi:hypothetical protein
MQAKRKADKVKIEQSAQKNYWRGYIDSQNKTDYLDDEVMCVSRHRKALEPLAKFLDLPIREFRSGLYVKIKNYDKRLPKIVDDNYIRGFFDSRGKLYADPLKVTVTSTMLPVFIKYVDKTLNIKLPKPMRPSKLSDTQRVTITGEIAKKFIEWFNL